MKKIYVPIFVAAYIFVQQNASAQVWMGVYGFRSSTTNYINPDVGGGFTMSFLSKEQSFSKAVPSPAPASAVATVVDPAKGLKVQYGADFSWSGLGHRTFYNVPLLAPQAGLAKVNINNFFFTMNLRARVSATNKSIFTPYADAMLGYRGTFSSMEITPYAQQWGTQKSTDQTLASVSGLNYGIGGGITTDLNRKKTIKLDIGVSYIEQLASGHMVDLNAASADANGVNLNMKQVPNGFVMLNVGLLFYLEGDGRDDADCNCHCRSHHASNTRGSWGWGSGSWGGGGGRSSSVGVHIGGGGGGFGGVRVK